MDDLSFAAIFAALGVGLLVHPVAMLGTAGIWMGKAQKRSYPKYLKITLALTIITAICVGILFFGLEFTSRRRGIRLLILAPICWLVVMKFYLKYALEQEQVDEFTLMVHYAAIHAGLYFLLNGLMA